MSIQLIIIIKTVRALPFLIIAKTDYANASYNKLILEQGELSSVFYLKPKDTHIKILAVLKAINA